MGLRDRLRGLGKPQPDGIAELHVGDPRFDDWEVIRDFDKLETARAWRQLLAERRMECVITSDWPLDDFGRGDIALRVPPGMADDAELLLDEPE